jgi:hypothetical protein
MIVDDNAYDGKLAINFDNNVSRVLVQSLKSIHAVLAEQCPAGSSRGTALIRAPLAAREVRKAQT